MFENFNPQNNEEVKRLFSYLEKDKFNSLSLSDQNSVIDTLINISNKNYGDTSIKTIGMTKGSDGFTNLDIQSIIDEMGYESFREVMRKAISKGGLSTNSVSASELANLVEKMKNGTITEEEKDVLDAIISNEFCYNSHEDIYFSTYSIIRIYTSLLKELAEDDKVVLLRDAEPFVSAAYTTLLSSFISKPDNAIGKMFEKHGFEKVQMSILDLAVKFSNIIIEYSKDNDIAPERTLMALMNVIKVLAGPLDTSLDAYPEDTLKDTLSHVLDVVFDAAPDSSLDELRKGSKDEENNDRINKSANADNKEYQSDNDIRKLLLDD